MSTASFRMKDELKEKVDKYLEKNHLSFSALANLALEKFISEPATIHLEPVNEDDFVNLAKKVYKKHKHAMDKLK
ncbi:MAG: hypothetical protein ACOYL6_17910 [Bacteriovoracaceae bacterium]